MTLRRIAAAVFALSSLALVGLVARAQTTPHITPPARVAPDFPTPSDSWIHGRHYAADQVWINSPPLHFADLAGKVVLVDFMEYTCINCVRTFDYLKAWDRLYRPLGLVIVGVHAPEFDFAYDPANVRRAVGRYGITFPVVVDSDYRIWRAWGNNSWPAKYLIGADHAVRFTHNGEGNYAEFEQQIRAALLAANPHVQLPAPYTTHDEEAFIPACGTMTPETYLGAARGAAPATDVHALDREGVPVITGAWAAEPDARRTTAAGATLAMSYHGAEIFSVIEHAPGASPVRVYLEQDGHPLARDTAGVDVRFEPDGRSYIDVDEGRNYYLAHNADGARRHAIRLSPQSAGLGVYSFTFGNRCLTHYAHL